MQSTDILGYVGGILTSLSFIPQVIKSWKTKSVKDLSILMLIVSVIGGLLWLAYGVLSHAMPIVIMNVLFIFVIAFQLFLKVMYDRKEKKKA